MAAWAAISIHHRPVNQVHGLIQSLVTGKVGLAGLLYGIQQFLVIYANLIDTADKVRQPVFSIRSGRLAMSASCKNKEAAWDFLRRMLLPQYTPAESENGFTVNRADFRKRFGAEQRGSHSVFSNPKCF